jgi:hypothetical protein
MLIVPLPYANTPLPLRKLVPAFAGGRECLWVILPLRGEGERESESRLKPRGGEPYAPCHKKVRGSLSHRQREGGALS